MEDRMALRGIVTLKLYGPDGDLKQEVVTSNIITNFGRSFMIDMLDKVDLPAPVQITVGAGTTANAASMTNLVSHLGDASASPSQPDAYTSRVAATFASGVGTGTITEVGRQAYAGTTNPSLAARTVLTGGDVVNKGASDSLVVTYDITYASA